MRPPKQAATDEKATESKDIEEAEETPLTLPSKDQKAGGNKAKNKRIPEVFKEKGGRNLLKINVKDVRVDLAKLDALINSVGELVLAESMVINNPVIAESEDETLQSAIHHLRRVAGDLQDIAMAARMIPLAAPLKR